MPGCRSILRPTRTSKGGVWNAWDEPAEGVVKAIEEFGRKNILAAAIDGTDWALAQLRKPDPDNAFIGTEVQNYELMGAMAAKILGEIFDGAKKPSDFPSVIYVPSILLTPKNVPAEGYPWTSSGEYKPGYEKLTPLAPILTTMKGIRDVGMRCVAFRRPGESIQ